MEPGCPVLSPGDSGCYLLSSVLASFAVSLWLRVSLFLTKDSDVNDLLSISCLQWCQGERAEPQASIKQAFHTRTGP
jgi:hypothetical protein